jgi:type I restriction enzyme S subunit
MSETKSDLKPSLPLKPSLRTQRSGVKQSVNENSEADCFVPRNDVPLTPKLRFKEFGGDWENKWLIDWDIVVLDGDRGSNYPNGNDFQDKGHCLFMNAKNVTKTGFSFVEKMFITKEKDEKLRKGKLKRDDLVLTTRGSVGHVAYYDQSVPFDHLRINSGMVLLRNNNVQITPKFIYVFFHSPKLIRQIETVAFGSAQPQLTVKEISKFKLNLPSLPEQKKIASFLSAVDEKIQQLSKKKELLEHYKKGVMQQLFSQQLRFKDKDGEDYPDWEEKRLIDVANRVVRKNRENNLNVLTISAQLGLISQLEYFNKSVSAKNVTNYYLLHRDEFAYNKSYSKGYPMGAIKRLNKYDKGVVSTLYICFGFNDKVSLDFMEQYFEFGRQNIELEKVAQEGARNHGLLNIGVNDFLNIEIKIPTHLEQQKIASYLSSIDVKIASVSQQIKKTKVFKKGLLQQMFV